MAFQKTRLKWRWGVNLFWIAYVGFSPQFPQQPFNPEVPWDHDIVPIAGEYICSRMEALLDHLPLKEETSEERWNLWLEWFTLRETWQKNGVNPADFHSRVTYKGA